MPTYSYFTVDVFTNRRFGEIGTAIETALRAYVQEVQAGTFPSQPAKPPVAAKPVSVI